MAGGGRPSHHLPQKLPLVERAIQGKAHGTQRRDSHKASGPSPYRRGGPWCSCLVSALACSQPRCGDNWVEAGQSGKHPRRALLRGSRRGKCTLEAKFVSITAGEISLCWKSQCWENLLMLLDKSVSIMEGGEAVGSAWEVVHVVLNEMPPAHGAPSLQGGLWDHQVPDQSSEASPPPLAALFLSCA